MIAINVLLLLFWWKPTACMVKSNNHTAFSPYMSRHWIKHLSKRTAGSEKLFAILPNMYSPDICHAWLCERSLLKDYLSGFIHHKLWLKFFFLNEQFEDQTLKLQLVACISASQPVKKQIIFNAASVSAMQSWIMPRRFYMKNYVSITIALNRFGT